MAGAARRLFLIFLAVVAAVAGIEIYALVAHRRAAVPAPSTAVAPALPAAPSAPVQLAAASPEGALDAPAAEAVVGPHVTLSGWSLAHDGIRAVEVRIDGHAFSARIGMPRPDVAAVKTEFADRGNGGFEFSGDFSPYPAAAGVDRRTLTVVAIGSNGRETVLGTRSLIEPAARDRWTWLAPGDTRPFYLLPALSGIDLGGAVELDTIYKPYESASVQAGFRVPTLYLRMTHGAANDYVFDPDWDPTRKCGQRRIGDDALNGVLAHARDHRLPVLVTLNGGIWADAYCDVPDWDINDKLEQDTANVQWNEKNEVMPDDFLKHLPGSQEAPELARALTFNVHATTVRHYKKRNLKAAGAVLARFAAAHPDLFVGVSLEPDLYLNPFFSEQQWYDYNPGTLRQFREWLSGTGPYAGSTSADVPDLRRYRRPRPLTLAQVNRIAGRNWKSWNEVDPPRAFPRTGEHPFWKDAWTYEWEVFRRHLVHLHYDELAQWLVEAGISPRQIWSSQGLMAPAGDAMPFAIDLDSPTRNYDSGGMTIAGSKPALGHLGVILYGEAAVNDVRMDNGKSLFATLASVDPRWAVVEFNTADLRSPQGRPTYAAAYRSLRDLWNFGARYVSPMAWNGSNGINVGKPGFSNFTAWRNTELEDAARDFMLARSGLPLGAALWTFGTRAHADGDGWTAASGTISLGHGFLTLDPDTDNRVVLESPRGVPVTAAKAATFVLGIDSPKRLLEARVSGRRSADGAWVPLADTGDRATLRRTPAGIALRRAGAAPAGAMLQLRVEMTFATADRRTLTRIAAIP